ncbi:MAG: GntR family transcriptional regulator [Lachnospiraceae bacterium]|nr:GntR family transcriptional regulator [Lachnospiraceae bacterium]
MTENLKLKMDEYLPLRDVVFNTLREAILRGDLKPGDRLMEIQLAEKLGVSRTPIREAIRMLENEGLAVTSPRKGATVAAMTIKDMEDVLQIRETLEELAVRLACDRINEDGIEKLRKNMSAFEESIKKGNIKAIAKCDEEFHDIIFASSNNPRLVSILSNIREQMYRYRIEYLKDPRNYPALLEEHKAIFRGITERSKEDVTSVMRCHIDNQIDCVKNMIEEQK